MGRPDGPRDPIAGPEPPEAPYPIKLRGPVIQGFGRGSKDLGIPTANIPLSGLSIGGHQDLASGIYYGWCTLDLSTVSSSATQAAPSATTTSSEPSSTPKEPTKSSSHAVHDLSYTSGPTTSDHGTSILPCVLSIGYNPYYANTQRSIEIHIMHSFNEDFYGATLALLIMGFIRPEYDYTSREALVEDIREDIRVAKRSLERRAYEDARDNDWLVEELPQVKKARAEQEGNPGRPNFV